MVRVACCVSSQLPSRSPILGICESIETFDQRESFCPPGDTESPPTEEIPSERLLGAADHSTGRKYANAA
jgi:hypothetical protein